MLIRIEFAQQMRAWPLVLGRSLHHVRVCPSFEKYLNALKVFVCDVRALLPVLRLAAYALLSFPFETGLDTRSAFGIAFTPLGCLSDSSLSCARHNCVWWMTLFVSVSTFVWGPWLRHWLGVPRTYDEPVRIELSECNPPCCTRANIS